ncbi:MAG: CDP-diacylglycerol--serine O-phosphatidyltransferase [Pseudomonadota bacterium]
MKPPFPEFDPEGEIDKAATPEIAAQEPPELFSEADDPKDEVAISRLRDVPFRMLVPNLITLGAICSGLTAIRFAFEGRFGFAVVAIVFAALLDALDGRVARILKSTTSFGEQMDSLADFVNFGVTPAIVLYLWTLNEAKALGWSVALVFAICGCLRLARFNVMLDNPDRPDWHVDFFTGVPAPAGALLSLLPVYLGLLGLESGGWVTVFTALYILTIGFLMVSNLPTWSAKRAGQRVSRNMVLPVMIGMMMIVVILFSYPWETLAFFSFVYLATLPLSYFQWQKREAAEASNKTPQA